MYLANHNILARLKWYSFYLATCVTKLKWPNELGSCVFSENWLPKFSNSRFVPALIEHCSCSKHFFPIHFLLISAVTKLKHFLDQKCISTTSLTSYMPFYFIGTRCVLQLRLIPDLFSPTLLSGLPRRVKGKWHDDIPHLYTLRWGYACWWKYQYNPSL